MSNDDWLKNPILPRPAAVPHFEPHELEGVPDNDRRVIARSYAREQRRQRSLHVSRVSRTALDSGAAPLRRTA